MVPVLSTTLFGPVSAIGLTLTYYDLRVRKEAFDLEQMMDPVPGWRGERCGRGCQRSAVGSQEQCTQTGTHQVW